jgi:hypothetical protein
MNYQVFDITGECAIAADSGQKLYDQIHAELLAGNSVELDFTRVKVFASAFFNFAIGQLLKDISPDDLNRLLHPHQSEWQWSNCFGTSYCQRQTLLPRSPLSKSC